MAERKVAVPCGHCKIKFTRNLFYCSNNCRYAAISSRADVRFWAHVRKGGPNECWPWTGNTFGVKRFPYGRLTRRGQSCVAHRVAYEITYGAIPDGLLVRHKCDFTLCCNPKHLLVGTHADNSRDKYDRGRENILRGSEKPDAKLNEELVKAIRNEYNDGDTLRQIAARYSISLAHTWFVVNRRSWKHI